MKNEIEPRSFSDFWYRSFGQTVQSSSGLSKIKQPDQYLSCIIGFFKCWKYFVNLCKDCKTGLIILCVCVTEDNWYSVRYCVASVSWELGRDCFDSYVRYSGIVCRAFLSCDYTVSRPLGRNLHQTYDCFNVQFQYRLVISSNWGCSSGRKSAARNQKSNWGSGSKFSGSVYEYFIVGNQRTFWRFKVILCCRRGCCY